MALPIIFLPRELKHGTSCSLILPAFFRKFNDILPQQVKLDFAALNFIEPVGVTFLCNLVSWLENRNVLSEFDTGKSLNQSLAYLDDSGFFRQMFGKNLRPFAKLRVTTTGLQRVQGDQSYAWLEMNFLPWLMGQMSIPQASFYPIKACLIELFNNVVDHSREVSGCVFGQHFPGRKLIVVSFSDSGIGIPAAINAYCGPMTAEAAIMKAAEDGFTTRSTPKNRGAGLSYLIRVIVATIGGSVTIYSLDGIVTFSNENGQVRATPVPGVGYCPGTTVEISIPTANIRIEEEEEEDFQW